MDKITIPYKDSEIIVTKSTGYDDGYYWDYNVDFLYNNESFNFIHAGSGSGYIPYFCAITRGEFTRLFGEEQIKCELDNYVKELIVKMLDKLGDKDHYEEKE